MIKAQIRISKIGDRFVLNVTGSDEPYVGYVRMICKLRRDEVYRAASNRVMQIDPKMTYKGRFSRFRLNIQKLYHTSPIPTSSDSIGKCANIVNWIDENTTGLWQISLQREGVVFSFENPTEAALCQLTNI